jgi:hypothetical protein
LAQFLIEECETPRFERAVVGVSRGPSRAPQSNAD